MANRSPRILTILILLLSASNISPKADSTKVHLTYHIDESKLGNIVSLSQLKWKYNPGDNNDWSQTSFNDSDWRLVHPESAKEIDTIGWFRLHLTIDTSLVNKPLGFTIWQAGVSKIYFNGELLYSIDENDGNWKGLPKYISFSKTHDNVIAIRYVVESINKFEQAGFLSGFYMQLGHLKQMGENRLNYVRRLISYQMSFVSLMIAVGVIYLILFLFQTSSKQNLLFALFLFFYAATIFFDYQHSLALNSSQFLFLIRMHRAFYSIFILLQLTFVYNLFYKSMPIQYWIIIIAGLIVGALVTLKPLENFELLDLIEIAIIFETIRVITIAFTKKKEGTWIITTAFALYYFFGIFDSLMDAGLIVPFIEMQNPYAIGSIGFILAMSVYLSKDFAQTNKNLAAKEVEKKLLEIENIRQSKELEEARQLQLSMLPKNLPEVKTLDIAVYMQTATEVGGDYYDFKLHEDGTLTVVIGDATGHGMKAGTIVAATKSLFNALANEPEPLQFIKKSSDAIKTMGLKQMFMALSIAKIKDNQMHIAAAGMPFPIVYRSATKQVEEIRLKGMPLGAFVEFPYEDKLITLSKGDTILLYSDGFDEMFNTKNEMFGTNNVNKLMQQIGSDSSNKIIEQLIEAGEQWADGRKQEDDVTFVVIKFL